MEIATWIMAICSICSLIISIKNRKDISVLKNEIGVGGIYNYNNNYENSDCPIIHEVHVEK